MKVIGVIPARYGSTRFPGKPLAKLLGKPMIQHVWERVSLAKGLSEVLVATCDPEIMAAGFGPGLCSISGIDENYCHCGRHP